MTLTLILSIVIYILLLFIIFLQYKGLINRNNKIIQIITFVFLLGGLFYFIYNSIYVSGIKDNILGIIFFALAILIKFAKLVINKKKK